ncbi:MAG: sigma-70 family RNA polymerase sigma factor [Acidimicrobiales bacterium]|jgi:RNA polymerase sigma-70 factor (sigma-E family)
MKSDNDEFRRFVADNSSTLLRAAFLLLRDRQLAEDAMQSTLMKTFQHWRRARKAPEAYSQVVLVNECRDFWRRSQRRPEWLRGESEANSEVIVPITDTIEQRLAIDDALRHLPALQREVLVLRYFLDQSVEEAAETLGIPAGTVKSSASRGLDELRRLLLLNDSKNWDEFQNRKEVRDAH